MAVKPVRAYLDSSAFGGPFDEEFAGPSRDMFEAIARGAERIPLSPEALALRSAYLAADLVKTLEAQDE